MPPTGPLRGSRVPPRLATTGVPRAARMSVPWWLAPPARGAPHVSENDVLPWTGQAHTGPPGRVSTLPAARGLSDALGLSLRRTATVVWNRDATFDAVYPCSTTYVGAMPAATNFTDTMGLSG